MSEPKVHIYGSSACAACKTAVSVAKGAGVNYEYHLIDQTPENAMAFAEFSRTANSRALPLSVYGESVYAGLASTLQLLREVA